MVTAALARIVVIDFTATGRPIVPGYTEPRKRKQGKNGWWDPVWVPCLGCGEFHGHGAGAEEYAADFSRCAPCSTFFRGKGYDVRIVGELGRDIRRGDLPRKNSKRRVEALRAWKKALPVGSWLAKAIGDCLANPIKEVRA